MIIFIGAGVSKLFGIPDMQGFIDLFEKDPSISETELYQNIKKTSTPTFDLENLMTILDDLSRKEDDLLSRISPQTTNFLFKNIEFIDHYIKTEKVKTEAKILLEKIKKNIMDKCHTAEIDNEDKILDIYDRFFKKMNMLGDPHDSYAESGDGQLFYPENLKLVTTNYDRCIEKYLEKRQVAVSDDLYRKSTRTLFDISSFNDGNHIVGLFKLHGSIDLFNIDGIIRHRDHYETKGEEVIYYPAEFSGYQNIIESPYLELFYLFRDRLNNQRLWIIIGSSLRDRTICSIMNDFIRLKNDVERPKILLVNPDTNTLSRLIDWGFSPLALRILPIYDPFGSDETNNTILEKARAQ